MTGGDGLEVTTQADIVENYGVVINIDDTESIYLIDWTPITDTHYTGRFYFDPRALSMADGDAFDLLQLLNRESVVVGRLVIGFTSGAYRLKLEIRDDAGAYHSSDWATITNEMHSIEMDWWTAWSDYFNDGRMNLWVDDFWVSTIGNIDNDTDRVDQVYWGAVMGVDAGTSGSFYVDDYEIAPNYKNGAQSVIACACDYDRWFRIRESYCLVRKHHGRWRFGRDQQLYA